MESSPRQNADVKATFRKLSNDAANRNYRRHSPTNGSSSSDEDLEHRHSSSPKYTRGDPVKGCDYGERKKADEKDTQRHSSRGHHGKSGDSYGYTERQSSRSTYNYSRRGSDLSRSRDYLRDRDKYSRDKYKSDIPSSKYLEDEKLSLERKKYRDKEIHTSDSGRRKSYFQEPERDRNDRDRDSRDKREYRRGSGGYQSGWDKDDSKGHFSESTISREQDGQKLLKERKFDDSVSIKGVDQFEKGSRNPADDKSIIEGAQNSPAKKPRLFSLDGGPDSGKQDDGGHQSKEVYKANSVQNNANASEVANDLNAAKFAAMRAAELVNRNLAGGTGFLSTEQKKKLLWGNKKNATPEESCSQWNVSLISDPERQEKFSKLMGAKGDVKPQEQKPRNIDGSGLVRAEKQEELQVNLEKQYIAGLRRRDGRTVGLGL
ncbi:hypothetical protein SAY86_019000 [Trapa natans]|uniref:Small acidic protein-like domain-containing protein n=1 Tax=Trapa natans TaxID=22666 RepID=A0AAN7LDP8_TRANT|nr:hypothetical protein SAY86_019000 [Trapa natans]